MTDDQKIKIAGLGYPVKKSKSPLIYNYWAQRYGVNLSYELCEWPPEDLKDGIKNLIKQGFKGFSVTLPHKQSVYELCDETDDTAEAMKAVNSVTIKDGKLFGTNTDGYGFHQNIIENFGDRCFSGPAVVLGAGGASRAILHTLLSAGVPEIRLTNRTFERAEELAQIAPDKIKPFEWDQRENILSDIHLLVNTTSLGMEGQGSLELDLKNLSPVAVVNDIVYYPLETELLKTAKTIGNPVVSGIGMLLHQARPSFKNWTGIDPEVTLDLEKLVLQ